VLKRIVICILFFVCCPTVFAGSFFNVSATGPAAQISLTLCLNGQGPLSCQNYTTSAINLSIATTIPNHTYPNAGIKINTPGYSLTGCSMNANGYCLFSASDTTAATIPLTSTTCTPDLIVFSPAVTTVNNPTGSTPNPSQQFTISMTMCNSQSQALIPSTNNPIHVNVYGAANGVITPASTTSSTGSATFTYSGATFPNNIMINAWISDPTNNGYAIGQTLVLQQNSLPCSYGSTSYPVKLSGGLPNPLMIKADVGYPSGSLTDTYKDYTIDTGSLGVIVPIGELPKNANVIGPGPVGVTYYDSSGNTYSGNYYLAPVRIKRPDGSSLETDPIMVLAINKGYCTGSPPPSCDPKNPPDPTQLHYLGVGFDRPGVGNPQDLLHSPAANAFLHVTNGNNGTDISPGYYLSPGQGLDGGLTLGISSPANYSLINLGPNSVVPGDFTLPNGCFNFTGGLTPQYCGSVFLDSGIDEMLISLPQAQWPLGDYVITPNTTPPTAIVNNGVNMMISAGSASPPQWQYTFTTSATACDSRNTGIAPCYVKLKDDSATGQITVNTGRRPLYQYDYFYQGQCGQVGFYKFPT